VEEGTLTKSLLRRLREIDEFGRGFTLFLRGKKYGLYFY
jgi:hypothetical protein